MALGSYAIIIYEFERATQPEEFTFRNSFWFAFTSITTLGFGDYIPLTRRGRVLTGFIVLTVCELVYVEYLQYH